VAWQRAAEHEHRPSGTASALARQLALSAAWRRAGLLVALTVGVTAGAVALLSLAALAGAAGRLEGDVRPLVEALLEAPLLALALGLALFALPWRRSEAAEVVQHLAGRTDDQLLTAAEALDGRARVSDLFGSLLELRATAIAADVPPQRLFWSVPWRAPSLATAAATAVFLVSLLFPAGWARLSPVGVSPFTHAGPPSGPAGRPTTVPAPALVDFSLTAEPPAYTARAALRLDRPGALTVPEGSRLALRTRFADCESLDLRWGAVSRHSSAVLSLEQTVLRPLQWSLAARGPGGHARLGPFAVDVLRDGKPTAQILQPARDLTLPDPCSVPLRLAAEDDYGLTQILLQWRTAGAKQWQSTVLAGDCGRRYEGEAGFDLVPMKLLPGSEVLVRLAARDNRELGGPQTTLSPVRRITIAPDTAAARERPAQAIEQAAAREEDAWQRLQRNMQELGDQLQRLDRQLEGGEGGDPGQRQAEMADAAQRLQKASADVKQAMAEAECKLSLEGLVDEQMLEKVAELHRLSQEVLDEQMKDLLDRLQDVMKAPDLSKLRADARQLREVHERFMRQLDQTLDLLKRARMEMMLEALQRKVAQLADRQQDTVKRTDAMKEADAAAAREADRQAELARQTQPLPEELQVAAERARELDPKTAQGLDALSARLQRDDPAGDMRQASSALRRLSPSSAGPPQRQALQSLRQAAADLAGMQADLMGRQRRELQGAAARAVAESVGLAQAQQQLLRQAEPLVQEMLLRAVQQKQQLERLSARQKAIAEGADRLGEQLRELSGKTPLAGPELAARMQAVGEEMQQAARSLQGGEGGAAQIAQQRSLAELNQLAADLVQLSQALGQQSAQAALSEYLKRLEQLAEQQRGLNQQSDQMGSGNPMLSELGMQQAMLKAALDKLMRGAGQQLSDKLGGVAGDMEDVSNELKARRLTQKTRTQQRDILHKMLDAQRSLYTREQQSRQRVAERPKPYQPPPSPPTVSPQGPPHLKLPKLEQPSVADVPPEYADVAEAYLKRLHGPTP